MSSDLADPTYAVVDKKVKTKKKAHQTPPQKPNEAMELYAVVDKSNKSRSSENLVGPSTELEDEAPTYDMIDSGYNPQAKPSALGGEAPVDMYSRIDRSTIPSKIPPASTPVVSAIPAKKEKEGDNGDPSKKNLSKITLASVILFVILGIILFGLIIALIMAFVEIIKLQGMLNTLKTDSSLSASTETAIAATPSPVNESELEANYTMLVESFDLLKMTINDLISNVTNETTADINERRERLDNLSSMLGVVNRAVNVEIPGNLSAIETDATARLMNISNDVSSTLEDLRQNFTSRIAGINSTTQSRLEEIRQVANQTILMGRLTN